MSALFFCVSLALWKYGYVIMPAIIRGANVVEIGRNFEIPASQDVVVGKNGGNFLATAFLCAKLYESASEKDGRQKASFGEMFERAISSAGFPFKVCALVSPLDLKREIEEIRTRRSLAESRKEKLSAAGATHEAEITRLEREIAMWSRQMERLTGG